MLLAVALFAVTVWLRMPKAGLFLRSQIPRPPDKDSWLKAGPACKLSIALHVVPGTSAHVELIAPQTRDGYNSGGLFWWGCGVGGALRGPR